MTISSNSKECSFSVRTVTLSERVSTDVTLVESLTLAPARAGLAILSSILWYVPAQKRFSISCQF